MTPTKEYLNMNTYTNITMSKTTELIDKLGKLKLQYADATAQAKKYKKLAESIAVEIEQVSQELST